MQPATLAKSTSRFGVATNGVQITSSIR